MAAAPDFGREIDEYQQWAMEIRPEYNPATPVTIGGGGRSASGGYTYGGGGIYYDANGNMVDFNEVENYLVSTRQLISPTPENLTSMGINGGYITSGGKLWVIYINSINGTKVNLQKSFKGGISFAASDPPFWWIERFLGEGFVKKWNEFWDLVPEMPNISAKDFLYKTSRSYIGDGYYGTEKIIGNVRTSKITITNDQLTKNLFIAMMDNYGIDGSWGSFLIGISNPTVLGALGGLTQSLLSNSKSSLINNAQDYYLRNGQSMGITLFFAYMPCVRSYSYPSYSLLIYQNNNDKLILNMKYPY